MSKTYVTINDDYVKVGKGWNGMYVSFTALVDLLSDEALRRVELETMSAIVNRSTTDDLYELKLADI